MKLNLKQSLNEAKNIAFLFKKIIALSRDKTSEELLKKLHGQKRRLLSVKKQPLTINTVNYVLHGIQPRGILQTKEELLKRAVYALDRLNEADKSIAEIGSTKIKRGSVILVHGYSELVTDILLEAKRHGINFEVHVTEARPSFDGRKTAIILSKHKIPVKYYADAALRQSLKKADLILIGADAISEHGQVFAEIGSELIAEMAAKYNVPVYAVADSWTFDKDSAKELELMTDLQPTEELWSRKPKGILVLNYDFEKISPRLITGIISEAGIYKPHNFISDIRQKYPWMFR